MEKLQSAFNPCTVDGLMCRNLISVSWDGCRYDCSFSLASGHPMGDRKTHISELDYLPGPGGPIVTDDHCYACTAGAGFT